jgi:hypothetical protein
VLSAHAHNLAQYTYVGNGRQAISMCVQGYVLYRALVVDRLGKVTIRSVQGFHSVSSSTMRIRVGIVVGKVTTAYMSSRPQSEPLPPNP